MMTIKTAKATAIFTGNPMASRLNCGWAFIIIPKIISDSKISAIIGKDIVKPIRNKFEKALMV